MSETVQFRKAFQGFHRDDVMNYISALNTRAEQMLEEQHQVAAREIEALRSKVAEMESRLETLAEANRQLESENEQLLQNASEMRREYTSAKNQLSEQRVGNSLLSAKVANYEQDYEKLKEKAEQYDKNAVELADVMLSARQEAARIVFDAKAEADTLLTEANRKRRETMEVYRTFKIQMADAKENILQSSDAIRQFLAAFDYYISEIDGSFGKHFEEKDEPASENFDETPEGEC